MHVFCPQAKTIQLTIFLSLAPGDAHKSVREINTKTLRLRNDNELTPKAPEKTGDGNRKAPLCRPMLL